MKDRIRYSADGAICMVEDERGLRAADSTDMDLPLGPDLAAEEISALTE